MIRVLVVAHRLDVGGTQTNAIELASEVARLGSAEIKMAAAPGPAQAWADARAVDLTLLPTSHRHPNLATVRALGALATEWGPDLIHVWDWPQCFDAYPALHLRRGLPMLCTVMGMVVPRFIPGHLMTTFGTVALADRAASLRRGPVRLLEPPVDLATNFPGVVDGTDFRERFEIDPNETLVTMVSRMENWLKMDSLVRGIDAVDALAVHHPVRLVLVGDGSARDEVTARANAVNARHRRRVVQLAGAMIDPRSAYEAADIMLGMGGSALKTLAFGTPLIVMGERGFSRVLDESTRIHFEHEGWYGLGEGAPDDLVSQLRSLLVTETRTRLGELGLQIVREKYDLGKSSESLAGYYEEAVALTSRRSRRIFEGGRTVGLLAAGSAKDAVARQGRRLNELKEKNS